ncbi:MAG TPA: sugar ABC transporter ATP-binding protein [Amaricoccus sp.]|nr:sugar ABC transporter ATP-binding protein [Amaricoccus sp.]
MTALLAFDGLSKDWFGVPAVADFTLEVEEGATHGLIGENGAGKSTLMNMVGGVVPPSSGRMTWRGTPHAPASPGDATEQGVAFIHQELNLFTNLSIAENVFIDGFPRRLGLIDRARIAGATRALLERLELDHGPDTIVGELAPGERQLVEIAKALHREADLIIFDEPTTSLTPRETARLFDVIARLKAEGRTVIYISHILGDVARLCDRVAVLRDGRLVDEGPAADFPIPRMIRSMIGRELSGLFPDRTAAATGEIVFRAEKLTQPGVLEKVSFQVHAGEILGLFGLMGSGRSELARAAFGLDPLEAGALALAGRPLTGPTADRIAAGMAFVTENRREEGLMMEASVADNLSLVAVRDFGRGPLALIDREAHAEATERARAELGIRAARIAAQPVKALSGGNQQKVVIGKWLMRDPRLFILDEPTRGVDVGAKFEIYALIDRLAAAGGGILFISSELEELVGMCDRILVMSRGELVGSFAPPFDREPILASAFRETIA